MERIWIAGPCAAESREQILTTASQLVTSSQEAGIELSFFRAGAWKMRSAPDGFTGAGEEALPWLQEVQNTHHIPVCVEVMNAKQVELCANYDIRTVWVGARTGVNPIEVQRIADAVKHSDFTVMVKNPIIPDLKLWMGNIDRFLQAGIQKVMAVHRGFTDAQENVYRNAPVWQLPIELKVQMPELPILCDPSHMGGHSDVIPTLSQQALDMGFDGLFIESHCNPSAALSDSEQQVTPLQLQEMLKSLVIRQKGQPNDVLNALRSQIDDCDTQLLEILNKRMSVSREIGCYKKGHDMQVVQTNRFDQILQNRVKQAQEMGMNGEFMKTVMSAIHQESVRQQIEIINNNDL